MQYLRQLICHKKLMTVNFGKEPGFPFKGLQWKIQNIDHISEAKVSIWNIRLFISV